MRIGIFGGDTANGPLSAIADQARSVAEAGFASFWLPQIFGVDAISALALIADDAPDIELGTSVVPTYPRHPTVLAQQALTAQDATGNRFTLGIGLSHQLVIEGLFGYSFAKPIRHMREYLETLVPLLRGENPGFAGETVTVRVGVDVKGATPPPVLVAALGTQMLELAGTLADGTVTWMTGPATIESHIVPTITAAAARAGRDAPRVGVGLPVCVTSDEARARERAARTFEMYGSLPSYRAMLDREGAPGPADVALVGDEDALAAQVQRLADGGATDFVANVYGTPEERDRTRALLRSLV